MMLSSIADQLTAAVLLLKPVEGLNLRKKPTKST